MVDRGSSARYVAGGDLREGKLCNVSTGRCDGVACCLVGGVARDKLSPL